MGRPQKSSHTLRSSLCCSNPLHPIFLCWLRRQQRYYYNSSANRHALRHFDHHDFAQRHLLSGPAPPIATHSAHPHRQIRPKPPRDNCAVPRRLQRVPSTQNTNSQYTCVTKRINSTYDAILLPADWEVFCTTSPSQFFFFSFLSVSMRPE